MARLSLTRADSSHDFRDGYAERCEAVQHGDTDLELSDLTIETPSGRTFARQFDAVHLGFDVASAVFRSGPPSNRMWMAPYHRLPIVRPRRFDARKISLRTIAPVCLPVVVWRSCGTV